MPAIDASFIGALGWVHLVLFGLFVPWLAIGSRRRVVAGGKLPRRTTHFTSTIVTIVAFAGVSWMTADREWIELFPARPPRAIDWLAGALLLALFIAVMYPGWRAAIGRNERIRTLFSPSGGVERMLWVMVSAAAGVGEEMTWRGVQWVLTTRLVGSAGVAALPCIASFSIAHAVQGRRSIARVSVIAAGLHLLVWFSGSLYVAMAVHFLYDVAAGFAYSHFTRKAAERATAASDPTAA